MVKTRTTKVMYTLTSVFVGPAHMNGRVRTFRIRYSEFSHVHFLCCDGHGDILCPYTKRILSFIFTAVVILCSNVSIPSIQQSAPYTTSFTYRQQRNSRLINSGRHKTHQTHRKLAVKLLKAKVQNLALKPNSSSCSCRR
jgi:hypothetical protein